MKGRLATHPTAAACDFKERVWKGEGWLSEWVCFPPWESPHDETFVPRTPSEERLAVAFSEDNSPLYRDFSLIEADRSFRAVMHWLPAFSFLA